MRDPWLPGSERKFKPYRCPICKKEDYHDYRDGRCVPFDKGKEKHTPVR